VGISTEDAVEVPTRWNVQRFSEVARVVKRVNRPELELLSVYLDRGVIRYSESGGQVHKPSLDLSLYQHVQPGDLVLNNQQAWRGSVGVSKYEGIVSPAYVVCELSRQMNPRYANSLFRSPLMVDQMVTASKGVGSIQRNLTMSYLRACKVPLPSLAEQELIVRYLDHTELRIAKAIAAKQRMIELLDEREELALLQAITQSDKPKTTDPRLDWLGEFPAHWDVKRLGSLLEERNEMNADRQVQQVLSLVRKRGVMRYEDKGRIGNKRSDDVARYKVVREGDIVLNSMNVIIGSVGQSAYTGCLSPVYYVLKPRSNEHHNAYFNALFQVERFHSSLVRFGKGILAHRMRIPMIDLKTVMLPVPPPDEQLAIADRVVKATAELRAAKAGVEAEIALLKEYRIRLISDVVTGKLDVRDEAAKLPDIDPMELVTVSLGENGDDEEVADDD
jgi:type I restriction enzyme S subunit